MQKYNFDSNKLIKFALKSITLHQNILFDFYKDYLDKQNYFYIDETNIIIIKDGFYLLGCSCEFNQDVVLGIKINNIIINEIESENNIINFYDTLKLLKNDIINFENLSTYDINIKNFSIINNNFIKLIKI